MIDRCSMLTNLRCTTSALTKCWCFKTDSIHWFQAPNINANELNCILGPGSSRFKDQSDWNKLRDFTIGFVCCSTVPIWRVQRFVVLVSSVLGVCFRPTVICLCVHAWLFLSAWEKLPQTIFVFFFTTSGSLLLPGRTFDFYTNNNAHFLFPTPNQQQSS